MKNKKIVIIVTITALMILVLLLLRFFSGDKQKKETFDDKMGEINRKQWEQTGEFDEVEDEGINFELSLIEKCDSGEWIEIDSERSIFEAKEFEGSVVTGDEEEDVEYFFEDGTRLIFSKMEFAEFFEDRDVVALALEKEGDLEILKMRCQDSIVDNEKEVPVTEEVEDFEQRVMVHLQNSIGDLIQKEGDWEVVSFLWPNSEYVYVEFSAIEKEEDFKIGETLESEDIDSFLLLLKISDDAKEIKTSEIGLLRMDEDDEWIAERGEDLFEDIDDGRLFDFDPDLGKWVKIY